jgi:hypothetical protein
MPKVVGSDDDDGKTEKGKDSHDENGRNILVGDMTLIITSLRITALRIMKLYNNNQNNDTQNNNS